MASSEDPRRSASAGNAGETTTSELGRSHHDGEDADVVGETSREAPRGVKDLRSITDPAAGSRARRAGGPEVARAISGLSR